MRETEGKKPLKVTREQISFFLLESLYVHAHKHFDVQGILTAETQKNCGLKYYNFLVTYVHVYRTCVS